MSEFFSRAYPLDDISIRKDGDGRTVEAYAAVFEPHEAEIHDAHGDYIEAIDRAAFNRTLSHNGTNVGVFYNHGLTLHGTPSDRGSVPLGKALEVRVEPRGVLTVTRYGKSPLADEVLDMIHEGAITGQSFSGRVVRSDKPTPRGGFRAARDGQLTRVVRMELGLKEYGPTPFPAYSGAEVIGVRSIVQRLDGLSNDERAELIRYLQQATPLDADPDADTTTSPHGDPGAETPPADSGHVGRLHRFQSARANAREIGVIR